MGIILLGLAIITFIYLLLTTLECLIGFYSIKNLSEQAPLAVSQLPSVSIIFAALNEGSNLEKTLSSFLMLNYPNLEIIAINDRSTDETPNILENIQAKYPKLKVFHIQELPKGWLGKNHALHFASQHAKGDWLLFTDADAFIKEPGISNAISYAMERKVDHVTIYENHSPKQFWLKILLLGSYICYCMEIKPWRTRYTWSKKYVGHGAFNLVKKDSYFKCGGHRDIAMECLDDMKLGHLMKANGFKQDMVNGRDFVERDWYISFTDMIKGFQKNSFAHFNFQLRTFLRDFVFAILIFIWPFLSVVYYHGPIRWVNFINILLTLLLSSYVATKFRVQKRYAICYPIAISLLLYAVWNSVISTYKNNGILWRGTYYPLKSLKKIKNIN